jgi:hypothetical protein
MRTVFTTTLATTAVATLLALGGCAIIVVPDEGSVRYESAFGSSAVQGNGQFATEKRSIGGMQGLDINGPFQVEVRVGEAPSLQLEGDSNLLPLVRTDIGGDTLRIGVNGRIQTTTPLHIIITTPQLTRVDANGSGKLSISGLQGDPLSLTQNGSRNVQLAGRVSRLDLRQNGSGSVNATGLDAGSTQASINGSGRLNLGQVRGETLSVELHGSGGVSGSGQVRSMNVRTHGSGSADLAGLSSQGAQLSTYGSGSISAAVTQSVVADTSGSGRITVYGNPAQRNISGKHVSVVE